MDAHYCRPALEGDTADVVGKPRFTHCLKSEDKSQSCNCGASGAGLKGAFVNSRPYLRSSTRAQLTHTPHATHTHAPPTLAT